MKTNQITANVIVEGFRGRAGLVSYEMVMSNATYAFHGLGKKHTPLTATLFYRRHFWTMDKWGKVYRIGNGRHGGHKMHTLCDGATIRVINYKG